MALKHILLECFRALIRLFISYWRFFWSKALLIGDLFVSHLKNFGTISTHLTLFGEFQVPMISKKLESFKPKLDIAPKQAAKILK